MCDCGWRTHRPPPAHAVVQWPLPHTPLRPRLALLSPPPHPPPTPTAKPTPGSSSSPSARLPRSPEASIPPPTHPPPSTSASASPPPPHARGDRCDPHHRASPLEAGGGGGCGLVGDVHTALTVANAHLMDGVLAAIRSLLLHSSCSGGLLMHLLLLRSDDGAAPFAVVTNKSSLGWNNATPSRLRCIRNRCGPCTPGGAEVRQRMRAALPTVRFHLCAACQPQPTLLSLDASSVVGMRTPREHRG